MNKHIKKISNYVMIGGMSAMVIATLTGCGSDAPKEEPKAEKPSIQKEGATVTIKESFDKDSNKTTYKIIDEVPSVTSRVILVDVNGTERILSKAEIDKLVAEEEKKVDAGTSNLTKNPDEVKESGGLGLAGTLMASMAAGMLGAALMNKLSNNQNYQNNRRASYSSPSTYSRSQNSFAKARANNAAAKAAGATKRSGFGKRPATKSFSSTRSSGFGG
ncbi:Putative flagellar motility protein [hydrothermal vent metagenome]|uniref:Putative flagellar motility protein n=1 Tax=hydrothermal vent metagenome TaxID=652676 RepID=A0A1W1BKZ9_9ZZZZ